MCHLTLTHGIVVEVFSTFITGDTHKVTAAAALASHLITGVAQRTIQVTAASCIQENIFKYIISIS